MTARRSKSVLSSPLLLALACLGGLACATPLTLPIPRLPSPIGGISAVRRVLEPDLPLGPEARRALEAELGPVYGARMIRAREGDNLTDIARRHGLGYLEVAAANPGIDPWLPGEGAPIVLPTAHLVPTVRREGIVINLAEQRLYLFDASRSADEQAADLSQGVSSYPIGVGRDGFETPLGKTHVVLKRKRPPWTPPASARQEDPTLPMVVPAGDDNPLGSHAIYLEWPTYLIHGTNEPYGVGRRVSRGCIRLYPEHIVKLYERVPIGTRVRVIHETIKLGWIGGEVFVEVHPTAEQLGELESEGSFTPRSTSEVRQRVTAFAESLLPEHDVSTRIDWDVVERAGRESRGIPIRITR